MENWSSRNRSESVPALRDPGTTVVQRGSEAQSGRGILAPGQIHIHCGKVSVALWKSDIGIVKVYHERNSSQETRVLS